MTPGSGERGGYPCRWQGWERWEPAGDSPPVGPSRPFHGTGERGRPVTVVAAIFLPGKPPSSPPPPASPAPIFVAGESRRALPARPPGSCGPAWRLSVNTVRLKELSRLLRGWGSDMPPPAVAVGTGCAGAVGRRRRGSLSQREGGTSAGAGRGELCFCPGVSVIVEVSGGDTEPRNL